MDPASEEYQDLATIEAAAQGAAKLMKQLKTLARGEDGKVETCAISQALNGALDLVCRVVPSKITVTREIHALAGRVALSSVAVELLVLNLVNNSVEAIRPRTGTIAVRLFCCAAPAVHSAAKEQEWVRIEVQDSGHGMTEEQRN
jgi:signal transduction histidine kinase